MRKYIKYTTIFFFITFTNNVLAANKNNETAVISEQQAKTEHFEWGTLITYFSGETTGTKDALSAIAIINPGMEIHPPHKHSEEEYLLIHSGTGIWSIKGKDFTAKAGDMLYAKPGDLHGLKNTGKTPLKFSVVKWNTKNQSE